jgi:hypothetical protein
MNKQKANSSWQTDQPSRVLKNLEAFKTYCALCAYCGSKKNLAPLRENRIEKSSKGAKHNSPVHKRW